MKHIFYTVVFALCALGAQAQDRVVATATRADNQTQWSIDVAIETARTDYCALQMDVDCGDSLAVSLVEAGAPMANHTLRSSVVGGATRVLGYSFGGETILLDGAPLLSLTVVPAIQLDENGRELEPYELENGSYTVRLRGISMVRSDGTEDALADAAVVLTVGTPIVDAVGAVRRDLSTEAYTLTGVRTRATSRGLYIINGRKVVKK